MSIVFQAEDQPVATRRDYWQQLMHEMLAPLDLRLAAPDFRSRVFAAEVGPAQVFELTVTEGEAFRTPRLIRRSDPGLCKVDVLISGRLVIEQDGREAVLRPGDLTFVDLSRPCHWANTTTARNVAVSFPRALLPLDDADLAGLTGVAIPGDRGTAALASSLTRQLPGQLDHCGGGEGARLGSAVLDLLTVVLAARAGRAGALPSGVRREALLARVHAFIEARLGDPGLSPSMIADAHHISLRLLYKLFEAQDVSVAAWIRRRRLERCRRDLLDPVLRSRPVGAIAARWGLTNPAHFSRAFRAAYGMTPVDFRALADRSRGDQASGPDGDGAVHV